jgi:hypothetical protein
MFLGNRHRLESVNMSDGRDTTPRHTPVPSIAHLQVKLKAEVVSRSIQRMIVARRIEAERVVASILRIETNCGDEKKNNA